MYLVTKNGITHNCKTKERYESFIASGWTDCKPDKKPKAKAENQTGENTK